MLIGAALAYAARGWRVFPCSPRTKAPLIPRKEGGRGHLDATDDFGTILAWWKRFPDAAIGNRPAEDEVVLDVDRRNLGDRSLLKLTTSLGPLPDTVTTITSDGQHYRLRIPWNLRLPTRLAPGIDLKGASGYIILPPSGHPSGAAYAWAPARSPQEQEVADLPDRWLTEIGRLTLPKSAGRPPSPSKERSPRAGAMMDPHLRRGGWRRPER